MTDILAADPQLAREIEFDLRRFDQQQEAALKQKLARKQSLSSRLSPAATTPGKRGRLFSPRNPVTPGRLTPGSIAAAKAATTPGTKSLAQHTPRISRSPTTYVECL